MNRRAARVDANQPDIVKDLRTIPGVSVVTNMNDILVGWRGNTYWYEIKNPGTISKRSGKVHESKVRESQKRLREEFKGHYKIVSTLEEILRDMGVIK